MSLVFSIGKSEVYAIPSNMANPALRHAHVPRGKPRSAPVTRTRSEMYSRTIQMSKRNSHPQMNNKSYAKRRTSYPTQRKHSPEVSTLPVNPFPPPSTRSQFKPQPPIGHIYEYRESCARVRHDYGCDDLRLIDTPYPMGKASWTKDGLVTTSGRTILWREISEVRVYSNTPFSGFMIEIKLHEGWSMSATCTPEDFLKSTQSLASS